MLVLLSSHLAVGPLRDGWVGGVLCGVAWWGVVSCWSSSSCARANRLRVCLQRRPRVSNRGSSRLMSTGSNTIPQKAVPTLVNRSGPNLTHPIPHHREADGTDRNHWTQHDRKRRGDLHEPLSERWTIPSPPPGIGKETIPCSFPEEGPWALHLDHIYYKHVRRTTNGRVTLRWSSLSYSRN